MFSIVSVALVCVFGNVASLALSIVLLSCTPSCSIYYISFFEFFNFVNYFRIGDDGDYFGFGVITPDTAPHLSCE